MCVVCVCVCALYYIKCTCPNVTTDHHSTTSLHLTPTTLSKPPHTTDATHNTLQTTNNTRHSHLPMVVVSTTHEYDHHEENKVDVQLNSTSKGTPWSLSGRDSRIGVIIGGVCLVLMVVAGTCFVKRRSLKNIYNRLFCKY